MKTMPAIGVEIKMLDFIIGCRRIALQPSPSGFSKTIISTPIAFKVS